MATKEKKQTAPASNGNGNKPVHVEKARGVRVSVFENLSNDGQTRFYKTTISRVYKEGEEFKTTHSLSRDDLLTAQQLIVQAWHWITQTEAKSEESEQA